MYNENGILLILLKESDYISSESFDSIIMDCRELMKLLISIIKSSKQRD